MPSTIDTPHSLNDRLAALPAEKRRVLVERLRAEPAAFRLFPLSPAQRRLWFLDRLRPGNPLYNVPQALALDGRLRPALLARALATIVARHETLRTTFVELGDMPYQHVGEVPPVRLPLVDLTALPAVPREAESRRLARREAVEPFDLARDPLWRRTLVRLGPERHVLLSTLHHIVSDGWSLGLLVNELEELYRSLVEGRVPALPELPIQYADFAVWQRDELAGDGRLARQLDHWLERLRGLSPVELPLDRPRPARPRHRGGRLIQQAGELPAGLGPALARHCREAGVTPFMVVLGAFQVLVGRLAGGRDVAVGTPIAGRNRREIEPLIGFFVNTLVLRLDLMDDPTFARVVERSRRSALDAFAHQDLPFERLVEELAPERETGKNPLFQAVFAAQTASGDLSLELPGLELEQLEAGGETARFDFQVDLWQDGPESFGAVVFYDRDLLDQTTVRRWLGGLWRLLAAGLAAPETPVSRLPLLALAERHQTLIEWSCPGGQAGPEDLRHLRDLPDLRLDARLLAVARRAPGAPAVEDAAGVRLTYGELVEWAERLARELRRRGVGPAETPVAVVGERSAETVVALVAVLLAGGHYVPLDPGHPVERLMFQLDDTGARLAVGGPEARALLADELSGRLEWVDPTAVGATTALEMDAESVEAERLAYVLYTSGSTGRPKGVAVPHRAVLRLFEQPGFARFGPGESWLLHSPLSFDASTLEIWGALATGGRLVVAPPGRLGTSELGEAIVSGGVTSLWLTAALFARMVEDAPESLGGVRQLLAGGEALPVGAVERSLELLPGTHLVDGYGPTENTTFTCCHRVLPGSRLRPSVPIGSPVAGTRVAVLDGAGRPVPAGVVGELHTGGAGLARGYLGRPGRTAGSFVPDPHAGLPGGGRPGARLYATGDLVRWLPEGVLEFVGRRDFQVKLRGHRIELGEVEAALREHPRVREAVVGVRGEEAEKRLVAWVVMEPPAAAGSGGPGGAEAALPDAEARTDRLARELRAHLARRLPEPMVPAAWVALDRLPLDPHGKLDRRALPEPAGPTASGRVAPSTETERAIARVWRELLDLERVGVDADFFELGGHSLLATQVTSRLGEELRTAVPLGLLFEHPRLEDLARALDELRRTPAAGPGDGLPPAPPLVAGGREAGAEAPPSFAQERLWFLERLRPEASLYNERLEIGLEGDLDAPALASALTRVAARHQALRTTLPAVAGRPVQRIGPVAAVPLPVVDLAALPEARRDGAARRLGDRLARTPFDLETGPLVRLALLRQRQGDADRPPLHRLLGLFHHVVIDGWSVALLWVEVTVLYRRATEETADAPPALPALPVQYADFAEWQRRWLSDGALERWIDWWRDTLAGIEPVEMPADRPRPAVQRHRGALVTAELSLERLDALRRLAAERGATLYMTLLALFGVFLARHAGGPDLVVGTPTAGRIRRELEELIGFFVNMVVVRLGIDPERTIGELVAATRSRAVAAFDRQEVPFERLVEALQPVRDLSRHPLFQVCFQVFEAGAVRRAPAPTGLRVVGEAVPPAPPAKWDLHLSLVETGDGLAARWEYDSALYDATTMERWSDRFLALVDAALERPEVAVAALPWGRPAERAQVLVEWSGAGRPLPPWAAEAADAAAAESARTVPADATLHGAFAARALERPEALALVGRSGADPSGEPVGWSYRDLARRVEALAELLRARPELADVDRAEVRIGVCLGRTVELPVALLAVLRAGGVYVPLDPAYPRERLEQVLEDSGARLVVTDPAAAEALPEGGPPRLLVDPGALDRSAAPGATGSRLPPPGPVPAARLAYLIYTSGSTGRPKGVAIPHGAAAALLAWAGSAFARQELARVYAATSVAFDLSVFELFVPWSVGGAVVLGRDALELADHPARHGVTLVNTVPSALAELVERDALPASVTTVALAGEPFPAALAERLAAVPGIVRVLNLYGPSEDTTYSTAAELLSEPTCPFGPPIGRPLEGGRAQLLVAEGAAGLVPVPPGAAGELHLGGPGLARGYLGRPAATAERFVPDPFAGRPGGGGPGSRLYATGDRVRWLADGRLRFLGRLDQQVKVRGFRIEPGEIEAALAAHPAVAEAAVLALGEGAERRLVAWVVSAPGASLPAVEELRRYLGERLPAPFLPQRFVALDALPRLPNGKLDRRALAGRGTRLGSAVEFRPPSGATEEAVAAVLTELLGIERVGRNDNFFDLGAHSLLLARAQALLEERLGRPVPVVDLFRHPTALSLAESLDGAGSEAAFGRTSDRAAHLAAGRDRRLARRALSGGSREDP